ncbi:uncharacterized protein BYT42DRAFT_501388 [Radiomyces spectabilis]|uniref:uncharacterized protein n=1 Tax=Radiomyces spectabilis TaxID=64574 RepID=UPI00221E5BE7|nr:uncharacterized protein BYT42DRAFT_501388 [Radiomyces spectabilis]KAI8371425.1 hypothetical protein BYT42DRAFT_501388 [Radiomyces spectabilis]
MDQQPPFGAFPAGPGRGVNGMRPYYTPGMTTDNYTTVAGQASGAVPQYANDYDDLIDSRAAARELINFTLLKYLNTAVSSPFEVSKTLLQVQYMPREDVPTPVMMLPQESEADDLHQERGSSDEEDDGNADDFYGTGSSSRGHRRFSTGGTPLQTSSLDIDDPAFKKEVPVDASGYVVSASVYDDSMRPPHQIKPIEKGVWQGINRLLKHPHEGIRSLFKGQYTNWLYEISHLFLQPTLEGTLNDMFDLYDDTIPLVYLDRAGPNLATLVASNLIVGFLLSPLELIRTR